MRSIARLIKINVAAMICLVGFTLIAPAHAADCGKALLGWDTSSGQHISGVLANEGVSKKNPLGKQSLKGDPGNWRVNKKTGKKELCGVPGARTIAGITCRDNPNFPFATATIEDVVKYYHDNQWKEIHGDELVSQYLAFKLFRLDINLGQITIILLEKTINDLNGKDKDFPLHAVMTPEMVKWLNDFTAPEILADGTKSNWRRWCFFYALKLNALDRYGDLIARNPKLAQFWENWSNQAEHDE